jgi:hypothetical protein
MMSQIMLVTPVGMVCMGVGNYGIVHRFPGVDIKLSLFTVDTPVGKFKQWFGHSVLITLINPIGFSSYDRHIYQPKRYGLVRFFANSCKKNTDFKANKVTFCTTKNEHK